MPQCRARVFLLWINRSPSDQVLVLLSDIQATSMSRTSWLDLSADLWLWERIGFPCTSFIPGHISASFALFCSKIRGQCRSAVRMGHRTYKRCPLADRPLPRRFVVLSWSPNSLWSFPLTATTRLSHHGISSHATTRCVCLKTATTRNFAL